MSAAATEWYRIKNIDELDSPALVVYPDRVKANIATAISMIGDVHRLRPHIKTNKSAEATSLMIAAGITKFKCATIAEAELLGKCGAVDVVLAYQPIGPKVERFITVIKKFTGTRYSCLTDNTEAATAMANAFNEAGLSVPVYLDINLGMNRTGIVPEKATALYIECLSLKGIQPIGLHAYDGHIRDVDFEKRKESCDTAFDKILAIQKEINTKVITAPKIIAGGSPTFSIHCKRKGIDCSPGTFIYWDKGYSDLCPEQPFLTAALVITRVISLPDATKICLDLGHKSIAAENEITRRVYFLNAPSLVPISQSEEHLVLEAGAHHGFHPGDTLYGLPIHICPTVALYERAITIENGVTSGEWLTLARDRKLSV